MKNIAYHYQIVAGGITPKEKTKSLSRLALISLKSFKTKLLLWYQLLYVTIIEQLSGELKKC